MQPAVSHKCLKDRRKSFQILGYEKIFLSLVLLTTRPMAMEELKITFRVPVCLKISHVGYKLHNIAKKKLFSAYLF